MAATMKPREIYLVCSSWGNIKPLLSSAGFGVLADKKEELGMPKATRTDHSFEDIKVVSTTTALLEVKESSEESDQVVAAEEEKYPMTVKFYKHLFENNPDMRAIFWRFNLFQTMDKIVFYLSSAKGVDNLEDRIFGLARRHKGRGIKNEDYDRISISFQWTLEQFRLGEKVVAAWMTAWHVFAECMKVKESEKSESDAAESLADKVWPTFTMEELRKHTHLDDLWLTIEGNVYDVTDFVPKHPGKKMIAMGAGKDATKLFTDFHSKYARSLLQKYQIGKLSAEEIKKLKTQTSSSSPASFFADQVS